MGYIVGGATTGYTDFEIPPADNPLGKKYIKDVMVYVYEMGYKGWLEMPGGDGFAPGLTPLESREVQNAWRGVHGYIAFGYGRVRSSDVPWESVETAGIPAAWCETHFINWQLQYIRPQVHPTALRIWTRKGVQLEVHYNIATLPDMLPGRNPIELSKGDEPIYPVGPLP